MHPQHRMKQAAAQQQQQLMQQAMLLQQAQQAQPPLFPGTHPHPGLLAAPQVGATLSDFSLPRLSGSTGVGIGVLIWGFPPRLREQEGLGSDLWISGLNGYLGVSRLRVSAGILGFSI